MKPIWIALVACGLGPALLGPSAQASSEQVLWTFGNGSDGQHPSAGVIEASGTVYGTTSAGGIYHDGTLFSLNLDTDSETILHSFRGTRDGEQPYASVIRVNGKLYGTAGGAANGGEGTLFAFHLKSGADRVLHTFHGTDGKGPRYLVNVNGTLYGTTVWGGAYGNGTVFSFDLRTRAAKTLYSFGNGADGANPYGALINVSGTLYGTTFAGGTSGNGTVFSFDPKTGDAKALYSFGSGTDGQTPYASLVDLNGTLYGTTYYGGTYGGGTVFSFDPQTDAEAVLWSFGNGTDGQNPFAGLTDLNGALFGTTSNGGAYGFGTVFALTPGNNAETVAWSFGHGTDGQNPTANLINVNGTLYGTTTAGGIYRGGTVFEVTP